ncbi:nucleoside-diphosphate-sugar epimerase [Nitrospirillum amazonense]|uniref:Nucleoside-diphosphate-sugar epimerase n=1 Tax=Nitrospirillum amazonense TaxID=28077 RepID=A0A560JVZ1_9PROT|nr:SDR family oxidoreductase [Nitrospirillum amazonense]TWB75282.1 nucleoside-diphosphate-sugar epimerase [Nitrospirillum amazonense]
MGMRVLVIGAYGLIGGYVVARLLAEGHAVTGVGRDVAAAARSLPQVRWARLDMATAAVEDWRPLLSDVQAVVNCAGALQDGPRDDLAAVHRDGVGRLVAACVQAGVRRLVHVSAAGVAADRGLGAQGDRFNDTKLATETLLRASGLDWIILRPGLVLAPAAYGGSALLRGLAALPGVLPVVHADATVQVVAATDVALAVARAVLPGTAAGRSIDLVHDEPVTLAGVVLSLRRWLGLPPVPLWHVPAGVARLAAKGADALAWAGWRSPLRTATLDQLRGGIAGDGRAMERELAIRPLSLADMLVAYPAGVQERWFAKSYFLKPAMLAMLAFFWALSGVVGFCRVPEATAVLTRAGMAQTPATLFVLLGSAIDLALGVGVVFRRRTKAALLGMVAVSGAYMLGGTLWRPDLWLDPMGPFLKTLPAAMLALAALALLDER